MLCEKPILVLDLFEKKSWQEWGKKDEGEGEEEREENRGKRAVMSAVLS